MTPLRALDEPFHERKDFPEYEIEARCANPHCPNRADDRHEIVPRSQTSGVSWWIELPGRYLLGNRIGLCRECHRKTDSHEQGIIWDEENEVWAYVDFEERWAEPLNPHPPVHKLEDPDVIPVIPPSAIDEEAVPESGLEPARSESESGREEPSEAQVLAERIRATEAFLRDLRDTNGDGTLEETEMPPMPPADPLVHVLEEGSGPTLDSAGTGLGEKAPVPPSSPVLDEEPPQDRLYVDGQEMRFDRVPASEVDPRARVLEPLEEEPPPLIEPVQIEPVEPPAPPPEPGSDERSVAAAIRAAKEAQERAQRSMEDLPADTRYRADMALDPESLDVELLSGDVRAKLLVEDLAERAKRAPMPKEKPIPRENGEREPAKVRRTWSINVPAEARDEGKIALGEDGANLLDDQLDLAREKIAMYDAGVRGWKYLTLVQVLTWFGQMYTPEGEE